MSKLSAYETPLFTNPQIEQFLQSGTFVELSGKAIYSHSTASSRSSHETLLLIHGFPTSSWDWQKINAPLAQLAHLEAIDMLGFGFSDKPNKRDYTIHQQASLQFEYLEYKGIREVHILCHDYGVSVAQEMLARQLERSSDIAIKSCCFLNGGLFPETHQALLIQKLLLGPLGPLLNRFSAFAQFKNSFASVFGAQTQPSEAELRDFWQIINYKDGKHLFHNLITYMRDRREHRERWLHALQASTVPLALINGSVDPVSGAHLVKRYRELGCRLDALTELPAIGHYPQIEDPHGVANAYAAFWRALP